MRIEAFENREREDAQPLAYRRGVPQRAAGETIWPPFTGLKLASGNQRWLHRFFVREAARRVAYVAPDGIEMDKMIYRDIEGNERLSDADTATLLAQLDCAPPASMDAGMKLLCHKLEELRRRAGHYRG
ncbi:MAG: hypothetical protein ACRYG4_10120 [Janthinobacterium lividum]